MDSRKNRNGKSGLDAAALEKLRSRLQHAVVKGPLPSVQVALAKDGELVLLETFGNANNANRYCIFSRTKPVVASAIWRLMGERQIEIERPVADYIPAFGYSGKQHFTLEQVLCQTAGFPRAPMAAPRWWTRVGRLGVPEQGDIASLEHIGEPPASNGMRELFGASLAWPSTIDHSLLMFNEPKVRALGVPGDGAVSTAADMALFYQCVMHNTEGLSQPQVLASAESTPNGS